MLSLDLCARNPGLCERRWLVFCEPMPHEVVRMIALPGQSCAGWYPADMTDVLGCEPLPPGECPDVFRAGCRAVGEAMPGLPPCAWHDNSWSGLATMTETRRRWRELPPCSFSHSGWHECRR